MKTIEVIKHAGDKSPIKVSSSILRWEPSASTLLMKYGGKWHPAVSLFDKVIIRYINNTDWLGRHKDRDAYSQLIYIQARERLDLLLNTGENLHFVEERNLSRLSILRGVSANLAPTVDQNMYWQWAFQYMLVTYCHTVRSAASELDSKLNALVTSTAYSQLSRDLEALSNTVSRGNVLNYSPDAVALKASIDKVNHSLYFTTGSLGVAYADNDGRKYNRPAITAKRLIVSSSGDLERSTYLGQVIHVDNPNMLFECWQDLVEIMTSIGITEPKPYGLTFCPDNLAALASLKDVAELDYDEPQKWRDTAMGATSVAFEESTPVSAMEFA
jgi:hypothetical protein